MIRTIIMSRLHKLKLWKNKKKEGENLSVFCVQVTVCNKNFPLCTDPVLPPQHGKTANTTQQSDPITIAPRFFFWRNPTFWLLYKKEPINVPQQLCDTNFGSLSFSLQSHHYIFFVLVLALISLFFSLFATNTKTVTSCHIPSNKIA